MKTKIEIDTHHHTMSEELVDWLDNNASFVSEDHTPNMESITFILENDPTGQIKNELMQCAWVRGEDGKLTLFK